MNDAFSAALVRILCHERCLVICICFVLFVCVCVCVCVFSVVQYVWLDSLVVLDSRSTGPGFSSHPFTLSLGMPLTHVPRSPSSMLSYQRR